MGLYYSTEESAAPAAPAAGKGVLYALSSDSRWYWKDSAGNVRKIASTSDKLSDFAATTSAELAGVISDETGSGALVFAGSPTLTGTVAVAALTATSTVTLSGTAANIALGANYISYGGTDVGLSMDASSNVTLSGALVVSSTIDLTGGVRPFRLYRSGGGDALTLGADVAGGGAELRVWNAGLTDYEPLIVVSEAITLFYRTGVGTASAGITLNSSGNTTIAGTLTVSGGTITTGSTTALSLETTAGAQLTLSNTAGSSRIPNGLRIGADSTNNLLDDASTGAGTATLYIGNASINVTSDVRLKRDILPTARDALVLVRALEVVDHYWNDPSDRSLWNRNSRGRWMSISAQQAVAHVPWLINAPDRYCPTCLAGKPCDAHPSPWNFDYSGMVPLLVKALQQIDQRLTAGGL